MNKRKEYLITIFIKKATMYYSIVASLEKSFELLKNSYTYVTNEEVKKLKEKFTIEEYIKRISPVIDETFSEEELNDVIKFYSTKAGSKLFDKIFLSKIGYASNNWFLEIEKEFTIKNAENQK